MNSPHKGQWHGALLFPLICVWINDWVNNREAGNLRRFRAHYDVIIMLDGNRIMREHKIVFFYEYGLHRLVIGYIFFQLWQLGEVTVYGKSNTVTLSSLYHHKLKIWYFQHRFASFYWIMIQKTWFYKRGSCYEIDMFRDGLTHWGPRYLFCKSECAELCDLLILFQTSFGYILNKGMNLSVIIPNIVWKLNIDVPYLN